MCKSGGKKVKMSLGIIWIQKKVDLGVKSECG